MPRDLLRVDSLVVFDSVYVHTNITISIPSICLTRVRFQVRQPTLTKSHLLYLSQLLLLRASDTELNPGPRSVKFPCGICKQGCYWRQRAICCDDCETWYHAKCIGMREVIYQPLTKSDEPFTCFNCGVPNLSSGLFDTVFADTDCNISSKSSIVSSDIPEYSCSSPSCNISDLSNITNVSQDSDSFKLDEDPIKQPLCSSPTKKTPEKLKDNNVTISCLNIQSVMGANKKPSFWNFLDNVSTDIVCGCETWLKPSIGDSEVLPPNSDYNVYRKDRPDGYGGSLLLIKNSIISESVDVSTGCDIVFRKIECSNSQTLIVGSAYRPTNNDVDYTSELIETISSVCHRFKDAVIWIAGDFNLPDIDWPNNSVISYQYRKAINDAFHELEGDLGLTQIVDFPTRDSNTLDLFFTNRPSLINRSTPIPGISDHHALYINSNISATRHKPGKRKIFMWGKADTPIIKEMCKNLSDTIIDSFTACSNINEVCLFFNRGCHLIIDDNVPHRMTSQRFTQPWINRDIRRLTRLKRRWLRRARRSNEQKDWEKYKALKKKTQKACRDGRDNYVNDILTNDSKNSKRYWNFIKSKKKDNTGMAPLKKDGLTFCDRQNQANIMGNQFSSVYTSEDTADLPDLGPSNTQSAPPINVEAKGIQKLLKDLKPHKASGPDSIPLDS